MRGGGGGNGVRDCAGPLHCTAVTAVQVRKVDTHVHHSACMNQKHLLVSAIVRSDACARPCRPPAPRHRVWPTAQNFIKGKLKNHPDEAVIIRDGKQL